MYAGYGGQVRWWVVALQNGPVFFQRIKGTFESVAQPLAGDKLLLSGGRQVVVADDTLRDRDVYQVL
jgi:hypothetical protein